MDEDDTRRSLTRGFFEFVGPAAVIGERSAGKKIRVLRGRLIHQHEQHLALHVHVLVVVPVEFGSIDPVAHPNDVGVDVIERLARFIHGDKVFAVDQINAAAPLLGSSVRVESS